MRRMFSLTLALSGALTLAACGDPAQPHPAAMRHLFLTSSMRSGFEIQTEGGADVACTNAAANAGLASASSRWVAWISASMSAIDRIRNVGPWYLPNGAGPVFANTGQLTMLPSLPINVTEFGAKVSGRRVWTGTGLGGAKKLGGPSDPSCGEWRNQMAMTGLAGFADAADASWTEGAYVSCLTPLSLYCFEQTIP